MRYVTLSYMLEENSPVHIGLKKLDIVPNNQISRGDGYNSYLISVENHSGTHIDAPGHFLENGKIISDYSPDELIFKHPLILDVPKDQNELIELQDVLEVNLNQVDCLFFRTGFEKFHDRDPEKYLTQNPGISPEVIYWIRKNFQDIHCIGMDCVSISSYQNPKARKRSAFRCFQKR